MASSFWIFLNLLKFLWEKKSLLAFTRPFSPHAALSPWQKQEVLRAKIFEPIHEWVLLVWENIEKVRDLSIEQTDLSHRVLNGFIHVSNLLSKNRSSKNKVLGQTSWTMLLICLCDISGTCILFHRCSVSLPEPLPPVLVSQAPVWFSSLPQARGSPCEPTYNHHSLHFHSNDRRLSAASPEARGFPPINVVAFQNSGTLVGSDLTLCCQSTFYNNLPPYIQAEEGSSGEAPPACC